jgi:hypothetical protein
MPSLQHMNESSLACQSGPPLAPYLWPRDFIVRTDHYSLKYLLDQRLSTIPQHAWVSKLFGYQFTVEFKPGRQNAATDALSRRDEEVTAVHAISTPEFEFFDQF